MPRPPHYRNLELRGNTYSVTVEVPPSLRSIIGAKRLRKTTGETEKGRAVLKRNAILHELRERIAKARQVQEHGEGKSATAEALAWQRELGEARTKNPQALDDLEPALADRSEAIEKARGLPAAKAFYDIATGKATPLTVHLEDWLREKAYKARQEVEFRKEVKGLAEWLAAQGIGEAVESVTDKVATSFKLRRFSGEGVHPATANKRLSALSSYWRWLLAHGIAEGNPWRGKFFPKQKPMAEERERAFTDEEITALLNGPAERDLWDLMMIGALSGMRREEIYQLRKSDCGGGVFKVRKGKTEAAERIVPIHPLLLKIVESRLEGRGAEAFLFAKGRSGWGETRGDEGGKKFIVYRKALGVDEKREGKRRSLVNFHSFRRWFITKADRAGCRREDIERCAGHKPQGQSLGVYSAGLELAQLRAVVEAVSLPETVRCAGPPKPQGHEIPEIKLKRPHTTPSQSPKRRRSRAD